jgi:hypothetical protein
MSGALGNLAAKGLVGVSDAEGLVMIQSDDESVTRMAKQASTLQM